MLNKQTIVSAGPASLLMVKLAEGGKGGKRHWTQAASFFFLPPKPTGFPIHCGGLKILPGSLVSAGDMKHGLSAWGCAIHWEASRARM